MEKKLDDAVARVRAAEMELNNAIRDLPIGIVVEVGTLEWSTITDRSPQQFVQLRIIREL